MKSCTVGGILVFRRGASGVGRIQESWYACFAVVSEVLGRQ